MSSPAVTPGLSQALSLHRHVLPKVDALLADAEMLSLGLSTSASGVTLVDAGIRATGGIEAGRRIAEICMAGLGDVSISAHTAAATAGGAVPWRYDVVVRSNRPVEACLASQYAGWSLNHGEGKTRFMAMGSGPARALACKEPLFAELGYRDASGRSVLVLEVDRTPPDEILDKVCRDCALEPQGLVVILTPTSSLSGLTQIVGRVLEVAMHKAHALHFPLDAVVEGIASAPLPPPSQDFLTSMGRSNDAILFGGHVQLFVRGPDDAARLLASQLPASASADYGQPFGEVFKAVGYDFYRIDPHLFAPAQVVVTCVESGRSFACGQRDDALLARSFAGEWVEPVRLA